MVNRPEIIDGTITAGDAPGFGMELDEEFIATYRQDR